MKTSFMGAKRVAVAIVLLVWVLLSGFFGHFWLAFFLGAFVYVGSREFVNIARAKGLNPPLYFVVVCNLLFVGFASFRLYNLFLPAFSLMMILAFLIVLFRGKSASMNDISITALALIYGGIFPTHVIMIRNLDETSISLLGHTVPIGLGLSLLLFLVITFCDVSAYYIGLNFGKTPLWKEISPNKTIKGAVGGTLGGIAMAVLVGGFIMKLNIFHSIIIGFLMAAAGQLGDLSESMLKRDAGLKDSGTIFPGHGGVLDRADSYIFTAVVAYYYFKVFIVPFN